MTADKNLIILGHRGAILDNAPFYQNSLRAFEEAVDTADGFETDACVDRDGEVFLMHEAKYSDPAKGVEYCAAEHLDATSAAFMGSHRIDEMTTADMKRLRLRDGSPVPMLREAIGLAGARDKLLNIELKAHYVAGPVLRLVKRSIKDGVIAPKNILISSFNHPALALVRREAPEIAIGALFIGKDHPEKQFFPWHSASGDYYRHLTREWLGGPLLKEINPDYAVLPEHILNEENRTLIAGYFSGIRYITYLDGDYAAWRLMTKGDAVSFDLSSRPQTDKLAAMIVDNPRAFAQTLRG